MNHMEATRMARVDGCIDACGNAQPPTATEPNLHGPGFTAYYRCDDCGATWRTAWED